jgi:hypothetical protein
MTERREVVVGSVLQAHQLQQYLRSAGINDFAAEGTKFTIAATTEQWTGIEEWLRRIGVDVAPATRLVDTGSFFVRVPKEES